MRIINSTPHLVTIVSGHRTHNLLPSHSFLARVNKMTETERIVSLTDHPELFVPIKITDYFDPSPLPSHPNTLYIVSRLYADVARHRTDVVFPTDLIRDEVGRVIGCGSLGRFK